MSVPDWPTTYGYNMFYFPFQGLGGRNLLRTLAPVDRQRRGLSHVRAGGLALLSGAAFGCVGWALSCRVFGLIEATIGGLRVVLSEDQLGIIHGALAQLLFVSVSLIALFTSRWWIGESRWRHRAKVEPPRPRDLLA